MITANGVPCLIKELNGLFIINIPLGAAEIHPLADFPLDCIFCLLSRYYYYFKLFFEFLVIQERYDVHMAYTSSSKKQKRMTIAFLFNISKSK